MQEMGAGGGPVSISEWGRSPGEGNGNPLQLSCLGKSHGQMSLVGCIVHRVVKVGHNLATKQPVVAQELSTPMIL